MPWITQRRVNWSQLSSKCNDVSNNWHNQPLPLYPYKPFTFGSTLSQQFNMMYNPMTFGTRTEFQACGGLSGVLYALASLSENAECFSHGHELCFHWRELQWQHHKSISNPATYLECLKWDHMCTSLIFTLPNTSTFEYLILTMEQNSLWVLPIGSTKNYFIIKNNTHHSLLLFPIHIIHSFMFIFYFFNILKINNTRATVSYRWLKRKVINVCVVGNAY